MKNNERQTVKGLFLNRMQFVPPLYDETLIEVSILGMLKNCLIFRLDLLILALQKRTRTNNSCNSILNNSCSMHNCRTMNNKIKYFELGLSPVHCVSCYTWFLRWLTVKNFNRCSTLPLRARLVPECTTTPLRLPRVDWY